MLYYGNYYVAGQERMPLSKAPDGEGAVVYEYDPIVGSFVSKYYTECSAFIHKCVAYNLKFLTFVQVAHQNYKYILMLNNAIHIFTTVII